MLDDKAQRLRGLPLGMMIAGVAMLGCGPWLVRLANVPPLDSAFWRLALATPPLVLLCRVLRQPLRVAPRTVATIMAAGLFYGTGTVALNISALHTSLANCALIGNCSSFLLAGLALVAARHRPPASVIIALMMAVTGVALLLGPSASFSIASAWGDLIAMIAAALFTGYFLVIGRLGGQAAPLAIHAMATGAGAVAIAPFALTDIALPTRWLPILLLAGAQIVAQGMVVYAVLRLPRMVSALCILIFPVVSAILGWIVYAERLAGLEAAGAALILAALPLIQSRSR